MEKTCFVVSSNGVVSAEAYTTLKDACSNLGVSYRMAILGKREFKGNRVITSVKINKNVNLIRKGKNIFKKRANVGSAN